MKTSTHISDDCMSDLVNVLYQSLHSFEAPLLSSRFATASPFPHLVLDGFLPSLLARQLEQEVRATALPVNSSNNLTQKRKLTCNRWDQFGQVTREVFSFFQSGSFLEFLSAVTGVSHLLTDPYLDGAGIHSTGQGGFLAMHTDFNWSRQLQLHRRLNVLLYLNEHWQDEWNGHLILSRHPSHQTANQAMKIAPRFNRMVVFNTNDHTFHGQPIPLTCPTDYPRASIAFYYYTRANRPWSERLRLPTTTTRYVPLKDQRMAMHDATRRQRLGYLVRRWIPFF